MKIISWNIQNIGNSKVSRRGNKYHFGQNFAALGYGNNLLDYVTRVAVGDPVWDNLQSTKPADIFVIIELKSGGDRKGNRAFGSATIVLSALMAAMNTLVVDRGLEEKYHYRNVKPLIVGWHESVGIIYNTKRLNPVSWQVLKDLDTNTHFGNFSPFMAIFDTLQREEFGQFAVTGVHAPTAKVNSEGGFAAPINYGHSLGSTHANQKEVSFIMGDFNCNPINSYQPLRGKERRMMDTLPSFETPMVGKRYLTSLKNSLSGHFPFCQTDYLANAFDNILRKTPTMHARVKVMDLLKFARNHNEEELPPAMEAHGQAVFKANRMISDHLPVMIEF